MDNAFRIIQKYERQNSIRLGTLVLLRWLAIFGQTIAILVAVWFFGLEIKTGPVALIVAVSFLANLYSLFAYPQNKRLSQRGATLMLVFDILQLGLLLYLTGGLSNPFAILILAPVTIAATFLSFGSTVLVSGCAMVLLTLISQFYLPIRLETGAELVLPRLLQFGFWVALVIGVAFLAIYARQITLEAQAMNDALVATQLALAREQKLTDLGGVVAATAHELGTPLATIKLVSGELLEEHKDHPALIEDIELIREQADRCRDILHSMGRAGKSDTHLQQAPLEAVVREAAEPHLNRGKQVLFDVSPMEDTHATQPVLSRQPEIIHGLRNLIQNAVDFADARVEIDISWSDTDVMLQIADDGAGFPLTVLSRIGDPFVGRKRRNSDKDRPGYEGMGLGLFIAKTLLERSGAKLKFLNGGDSQQARGAIISVIWPRDAVEQASELTTLPLASNELILP